MPSIRRAVLVVPALAVALALPVFADEADDIKNPEKAIKTFTTATEKAPDDSDAWMNLGLAYMKAKNPAEAAKAFSKAAELVPTDGKAHYWLGRALADQKKSADAMAEFAKAAEIEKPTTPGEAGSATFLDAEARLAKAAMDAEKWDDAIEAYKATLKGKPDQKVTMGLYNQLGVAYLRKGDTNEAVRWFEKTTESGSPDAWYNLGQTYRKVALSMSQEGKEGASAMWGKTADAFVKYASSNQSDVIAQYFAGDALFMAGRKADALTYIDRYLAGDPDGSKAVAKFGSAGKQVHAEALETKKELTP